MRTPALAFAWEFLRRHRWGFVAIGAYMVVLAAMRPALRGDFANTESFAFAVLVPTSATFMYFLAVFTFGLAGDVAGRPSMYPARMLTLPVTTSALAGWPMLYGGVAMMILWLGTRLFAKWPAGAEIPVYWPLLFGPVLLGWMQALTWMPYPLPGLRVAFAVVWLTTIDAVIMTALELKASEAVMLALLAPHLPLAFLVARHAVAKARRGDVPDWRGRFAASRPTARVRDAFASATRAQEWIEWRQHGRSLPAMVAIVLPFQLWLLFVFGEAPVIVYEVLACALLTPPLMATFVAATVSYAVTPFVATRPLENHALIAAKLKATIRSTLAAWLLVAIAVPLALWLSGTTHLVLDVWRWLVEAIGTPRAAVLLALALAAMMAVTWKQLVQSLYIGMSGREWLIKGSAFVVLVFLAVAFPLGHWVLHSKPAIAMLWNASPWILAALVASKLFAGGWIAVRLHDRRLLSERALVAGAACWSGAVFALYGLLVWLLPALLFHRWFLALVAILALPLARLSAAPLALAENRHR